MNNPIKNSKINPLVFILFVSCFLILFLLRSHLIPDESYITSQFHEITYGDFHGFIKEKKSFTLFLGKKTCVYCQQSTQILSNIPADVYYLDTLNLGDSKPLLNSLHPIYEDYDRVVVPLLLRIEEGVIKDYHLGGIKGQDKTLTDKQEKELIEIYKRILEV